MASCTESPQLQAEAASVLSMLARRGQTSSASLLQSPEAVGAALVQLLRSEHLNVAYPAAQALLALATCTDAGPLLLTPDLLRAAAQQSMDVRLGLAHGVFAQALALGVHRCAGQMQ